MNTLKKLLSIILVIACLTTIFIFSSKSSLDSNHTSKKFIYIALTEGLRFTNRMGLTNKYVTHKRKLEVAARLNLPVRKLAHATIYFILAFIIINLFRRFKLGKYKTVILAIILCFIYAMTDEYHQTFVSGRTGVFTDVLIDTTGAFISSTICLILMKLKEKN